ncbi:hypothetical protein Mycch_4321 [Mycolicibacterium chubuense NBB4]|uniref:CDGP domain-containing protein n=1 Tax=Mycolicibacterium chubuense (strain NBB4) TaxID=710421 RepID=I4BP24_MYCCN|nr:hypothetical protein [Mycolicibacterium chubuense]AFM19031.1 hypothetical protein Mycch_4321 [Mycolicibacterium chubuense NBB4]
MRRIIIGIGAVVAGLLLAGLLFGGIAQVLGKVQHEPPIQATGPCGGAVILGNGGSQCDGPIQPDGSFTRCTSVYVLGFGGWSCYTVYPPR